MLLGLAMAADLRPVRAGQTVESLAEGDPRLADQIRALNGLAPGAQPAVGDLIELPAPPGPHGEQLAFLIALVGTGTFTDPAGVPEPAVPWVPIPAGTTVCTGADSFGTLRLASTCNADGSASDDVLLHPETCVAVDAAFSSEVRRSTVIRVTRGSVAVQPAPSALGHVTVITPSGTTTGEQGGYRVTIEPSAARTEALTAPVAVQGAGQEVALAAGQGSRVATGQPPSAPVDLLVTTTLGSPAPGAPLRKPEFSWPPVADALGYRLEIARSAEFLELVFQEDVPAPRYLAPLLMLPLDGGSRLHWRVAAFDRLGFLGPPTEPRLLRVPDVR